MSASNTLFALGSNGSGQLGVGHRDDVSSPQRCVFDDAAFQLLDPNDKVTKMVAGGNHTLVLFASGAVFASGSNECGQCGLPTSVAHTVVYRRVKFQSESHSSARELMLFEDISATWEASFFISHHRIYVRGRGMKGELGLGEGVTQTDETVGVIALSDLDCSGRIDVIKSSMSHTVVLADDGQLLLGWGAGRKGQLGEDNKKEKIVRTPRKISMPLQGTKIALGRDFTFVAGEKDRWHWFLGDPEYESTYLPDLKSFMVASEEETYDLTASWSNIYALNHSDRQLKGWGRNDRGQLAPKNLPRLKSIAAGSEHCVGLTMEDKIVAWGWGEHGNCGPDVDAQSNVSGGRWNVLCVPLTETEEVVGVAAGCATSFIIVSAAALHTTDEMLTSSLEG